MTVITDRLTAITYLDKGAHGESEQEFCLLEAAAFVAGEPHSDHPKCVSPILGSFGRAAGDAAWAAAWAAARDVLRPTVTELQDSAIALFRRMIEVSA